MNDGSSPIPDRLCDVVMKGGITSGVVYPAAITELAKSYRFKSIGGTSAGAIAAALTAAAELGRNRPGGGFACLEELPAELARNLLSLFQPVRATRSAFAVLVACLGCRPLWRKALGVLTALVAHHWPWTLAGLLVGWGVDRALVAVLAADPPWVVGWVLGVGVGLVSALLLTAVVFVAQAWRGLSANGFGLCSGMPDGERRTESTPLTIWLTALLDKMAGLPEGAGPLTFGDLWGLARDASEEQKDELRAKPDLRQVNLEVMTTNLMHGRPYRIPFLNNLFFFRETDLRPLFPSAVVDWMVERSQPANHPDNAQEGLRHLPHPADLPVVVAVRLSLSFPFLLSAVPLYAVDFRRPLNQAASRDHKPLLYERCWFSDGGIGSNFPIHFFDGLLPGHPTFGINLRSFPPNDDGSEVEVAPDDLALCVDFPQAPQGEVLPDWNRFGGLLGFPGAIVQAMQSWVDSTQIQLPGYRD
ncbi:MAG TPA: patatin-like phospholipase family protein, partial [Thermoanaerobaculia bacterium]